MSLRTEMYLNSVERIMRMKGIEVNITNHPAMGQILERGHRLKSRKPGEPHPFVAPDEFKTWLKERMANVQEKLQDEKRQARRKQ